MGVLRAWRFPKWLLEGVATYTANQRGTTFYPSKEETYRLMREGNFVPPQAFHTMAEDRIELRVRYRESFIYSELACLVDYLIGMLGRDRFQAYLTRMMTDGDEGKVFQETYGVSFDEAVRGFRDQVLRGKSRKAEVPDEGA
jgi:hypothetical protein